MLAHARCSRGCPWMLEDEKDLRSRAARTRLPALGGDLVVGGGGFEPPKAMPSDLQSDPFGHSGIPPLVDEFPWRARAWSALRGSPRIPTGVRGRDVSVRAHVLLGLGGTCSRLIRSPVSLPRNNPASAGGPHGAVVARATVAGAGQTLDPSKRTLVLVPVGASGGSRTRSLLITNQMLCQLSYAGGGPADARPLRQASDSPPRSRAPGAEKGPQRIRRSGGRASLRSFFPHHPDGQSARTRSRQASKAARTWSRASPPNFSRKAAASSRARTASPTTLAAGTEVTSERW